jgi:hypothetical protein
MLSCAPLFAFISLIGNSKSKICQDIIILLSLHDVNEVNAYSADQVCVRPSIRLSAWFIDIVGGLIFIKFGIGVQHKRVLLCFL